MVRSHGHGKHDALHKRVSPVMGTLSPRLTSAEHQRLLTVPCKSVSAVHIFLQSPGGLQPKRRGRAGGVARAALQSCVRALAETPAPKIWRSSRSQNETNAQLKRARVSDKAHSEARR